MTPPDKQTWLTDEQIDEVAERAADLAVRKLTENAYKAVGKSVIEKLFYIVGVLTLALYLWAKEKGLVSH